MHHQKITIILATLNEEQYIEKCLDSLIHQDRKNIDFDLEIIIADGGSTDNTRAILAKYQNNYSFVRWYNNPKKFAPSGWNICLSHANGNIIILMGAHATLDPDYMYKTLLLFERVPSASCVGGLVTTQSKGFLQKAIALAVTCPFGIGNARYRYAKTEQYVETVAFGAYKKEVFSTIGNFNEEMVRNNDWEFNYRMTKAGMKFYFDPSLKITYFPRTSLNKLWKQQFWTSFWKIRVIQLYPESFLLRHIIPFLFIISLLSGGLISFFSKTVFFFWSCMVLSYLTGALYFAFKSSKKEKPHYSLILPFLFFWLHLSYGTGFAAGIFYYLKTWRKDRIMITKDTHGPRNIFQKDNA